MNKIEDEIVALRSMKKYPKQLFYDGNLELLKQKKIAIVGSRKPTQYSRNLAHQLSHALSCAGVCIVSGGAMGIDAIAHLGAGSSNTIAVLPCGIDIKYPSVNKNLLTDIQKNGLLLSQFDEGFRSAPWSFVVRNELVVALGDILVVAEADEGSGSLRSIEFALAQGKEIYVFAQRVGESSATNNLLKEGKAKAIYDIDAFVASFTQDIFPHANKVPHPKSSDFLEFCKTNPTYEEALKKYPEKLFEAELSGFIEIKNARVYLI
ncbi:MAG: DNA-processing protein DprA [Sulfurimonas sp.]|jgi:DNA processing protein